MRAPPPGWLGGGCSPAPRAWRQTGDRRSGRVRPGRFASFGGSSQASAGHGVSRRCSDPASGGVRLTEENPPSRGEAEPVSVQPWVIPLTRNASGKSGGSRKMGAVGSVFIFRPPAWPGIRTAIQSNSFQRDGNGWRSTTQSGGFWTCSRPGPGILSRVLVSLLASWWQSVG